VLAADAEGPLSSTRIRGLVADGNMQSAAELLGRPHALSGVVARGAQRGRTIGFPTANLSEVPELLPANGVYAVSVDLLAAPDGPPSRALGHGVMNVGTRPTVSGGSPERHVEVHLFDVSLDLYGRPLRVHVRERVRDERKFESFEALREQIVKDAATARALTAAIPVPASGGFD
jgi:riboflavin kinase / FMN adenylyltransferase